MAIRNVPVHPRLPRLHVGGPVLGILLILVLSIAIALAILQQSSVPREQAVPSAPQSTGLTSSTRDQWWLDQPAKPTPGPPVRDQWWLEQ